MLPCEKLQVLVADYPYTILYNDNVYLHLHLNFVTKIVLEFYVNQGIDSPTFFPKDEERIHTFDIRMVLAFYLDRTRSFRLSSQLFIAVADRMKVSQFRTTAPALPLYHPARAPPSLAVSSLRWRHGSLSLQTRVSPGWTVPYLHCVIPSKNSA